MNSTRRKLIVAICLDLINQYHEELEEFYVEENDDNEFVELNINGKLMFPPSVNELHQFESNSANGNWRTKQIVEIALTFAEDRLEYLQDEYPYEGTQERFVDTHISFNEINFLLPTQQEIQELLSNLSFTNRMPAIVTGQIGWTIYGPDEEDCHVMLDKVFYDPSCDSKYVKNGLVEHDGYPSNIAIVPSF